jgi:hypothetical protein
MLISSAAISVAERLRSHNFFFVRRVSCIRRQKRAFIFARRRRRREPACTECAAILPPKKRFERCFKYFVSAQRRVRVNTYLLIPSYSRDGHTHILLIDSMGRLWRSNCYSKFRRLAERRCYLGPRSHPIGMSAIFFGHTNTLSFHDPPGPAIHSGQKSQLAWRCCFPLADSNCWPSFSSVASSHNSCT